MPGSNHTSTADTSQENQVAQNKITYHNGMLYFSLPHTQKVTISLIDSTGTLLKILSEDKATQAGDNKLPLNFDAYDKGVYLIKMEVGGASFVERILNI